MEFNYLNLFKCYCIFNDWAPLGSGVGDMGVGVIWGIGGALTHMHTCTCTCGYPKIYMYRNYKWPPSWVSCLLTCACACMQVCLCVWEATPMPLDPPPSHAPRYPHPLPPPPEPQGAQISKNAIKLEQDISFPSEDLKSVEISPLMGGYMVWFGGWLGGWVDGWGHVKSLNI